VVMTGVVAVVATGAGGTMAEVYDDRPDAHVPADRPLTAGDLRKVRFTTAFRGYRMSEVDALLARLADQLADPPAEEPAEPPAEGPADPPAEGPADPPAEEPAVDAGHEPGTTGPAAGSPSARAGIGWPEGGTADA
jgi:DivIVA domain-containing protein